MLDGDDSLTLTDGVRSTELLSDPGKPTCHVGRLNGVTAAGRHAVVFSITFVPLP